MEKFQCPNCGFKVNVDFSENETAREVPCGQCYWEEWTLVDGETVKTEHGQKIQTVKGEGI